MLGAVAMKRWAANWATAGLENKHLASISDWVETVTIEMEISWRNVHSRGSSIFGWMIKWWRNSRNRVKKWIEVVGFSKRKYKHFPSNVQIVHKIIMQHHYFLKEVQLNNFKSYGTPIKVSFNHQLSCVVGRNGCGKSALIDAICCCLGVDCKQLRCRKYSDLITHLEGKTAEKCSIQLLFENCNSEKNTITFGFTTSKDGTTV